MNIVNTVPPGLIVTFWPDAVLLAVTVTVTVAPALIVPAEGLRCTVPSPLDTVLDQVTGPPCAVREIVVPPGGTTSAPPDGETASVPGVALAVAVGVDVVLSSLSPSDRSSRTGAWPASSRGWPRSACPAARS